MAPGIPKRPWPLLDYITTLCTDFQELHGDRQFNDDRALVGGTAFFGGRPVMVIAQQKGRDARENILRNYGMPQPEGYRKALRLMKLAEKFHLPLICFVDTMGAYPGVESEARHVSEAIAVNLREMAMLKVPSIAASRRRRRFRRRAGHRCDRPRAGFRKRLLLRDLARNGCAAVPLEGSRPRAQGRRGPEAQCLFLARSWA